MGDRLDLLLLGASGFTGMQCIPQIYKLEVSKGRSLTWGVAGRSEKKLKLILESVGKKIDANFQDIPVIVVDINDDESLFKMAQRAKVVLNCCGPYHLLGESVVKACIAAGTHQVDVTAEIHYMEKIQLELDEAARKNGVYIVSACGFDSIPTDLGVITLQKKFEGTLNSVATYLEVWSDAGFSEPFVNYGSWESLIYCLAHWNHLREIRKKLFPKRISNFKPKLMPKFSSFKSGLVDGWVLPYPGSDLSCVTRSQYHFYEVDGQRPVEVDTYLVVKSYLQLIFIIVFGIIFFLLCNFAWGRNILLRYPEIFSFGFMSNKKQPTEEEVEKICYQITFRGEGWKNKLGKDETCDKPCDSYIVGHIKGRNVYKATAVAMVEAANIILTESHKIPGSGGVLPPGAIFEKTSLFKHLDENDITTKWGLFRTQYFYNISN